MEQQALHAIRTQDAKALAALLAAGLSPLARMPPVRPSSHCRPLAFLCTDQPALLAAFLNAGLPPDTTWGATDCPLLHLACKDDIRSARLLLKAGANPDMQDKEGNTPLHVVVDLRKSMKVRLPLLRLLLSSGANPRLADRRGQTPIDLARLWGDGDKMIECINTHAVRQCRKELEVSVPKPSSSPSRSRL